MPEIKGGVPDPMPVRVSTASDQPTLSPTVIRNFPAKPIGSTRVEVPLISSTAATHDESSSHQRRLHVTVEAPAPGSASIVLEVPPDVPAITSGSFGPSVTSPPSKVASTALNPYSAKERITGVHREDAEAANVSAAASANDASADGAIAATKVTAPTIMPPHRTDAHGKGVAKNGKRAVQTSQAQTAKRANPSEAR
jgi:hypothetical protein